MSEYRPEVVATRFGMKYGPAVISRVCSDPKLGVWIEVMGARQRCVIRVTNSGQVRIGKAEKSGADYFKSISEPVK